MPEENQDNKNVEERQIVVFKLGEEEFGVNINEVREIIRYEQITRVPNTQQYIKGVINLRGGIFVVVDLAMKLGIAPKEVDKNTRIIVIELGESAVGMIVDSATEVMRITGEHIKPAPEIITEKINSEYIEGVGIVDERLLILLDLAKVLQSKDVAAIESIRESVSSVQQSTQPENKPESEDNNVNNPNNDESSDSSKEEKDEEDLTKEESPVLEENQEQSPPESGENNSQAEQKEESQEENISAEGNSNEEGNVKINSPENNDSINADTKEENNDNEINSQSEEAQLNTQNNTNEHPTLQDAHEDFHFIDHEGNPIKNVHELLAYIKNLSEDVFKIYVNEEKNDFYNWIKNVIKDEELAEKIKGLNSKDDVSKEIMNRILAIKLEE